MNFQRFVLEGLVFEVIRAEIGEFFTGCWRFHSKDLAIFEPGPGLGSVSGGSVILVVPESSYISLSYRCE